MLRSHRNFKDIRNIQLLEKQIKINIDKYMKNKKYINLFISLVIRTLLQMVSEHSNLKSTEVRYVLELVLKELVLKLD